jgi:transcriptional regulator with XRE-family HTH domain
VKSTLELATFGKRLREVRKQRNLTLQALSKLVGVPVSTISRIERGGAENVESNNLLTLSRWAAFPLELFFPNNESQNAVSASVPDVVEIHLRADKSLDNTTAIILAKMFRAAYEQAAATMKKEKE